MEVSFAWVGAAPPDVAAVEKHVAGSVGTLLASLSGAPQQLTVRLAMDDWQTAIHGAAFDAQGRAVVKFRYSLSRGSPADFKYVGGGAAGTPGEPSSAGPLQSP